ncbi:MAG: hypothetical protein COA38_03700 [Fluviicola sp.]|nr:MAG: hypothetical protein COA38_03700 [Fluviicola sp.]
MKKTLFILSFCSLFVTSCNSNREKLNDDLGNFTEINTEQDSIFNHSTTISENNSSLNSPKNEIKLDDIGKTIPLSDSIILTTENDLGDFFKINGKVQEISYSQGGIRIHPDNFLPTELSNCTVQAIACKKNGEKVLVEVTKSDSLGNFGFNLPKGKYTFCVVSNGEEKTVEFENYEINKTVPPEDTPEQDWGWSQSNYWILNAEGPIIVGQNWTKELIITHYQISSCYMCP